MRFTRNFVDAISWSADETVDVEEPFGLISLREAFNYADERCNRWNLLLGRQDPQMWPAEDDFTVHPQKGKPGSSSSLSFFALCPVELVITDPNGGTLSTRMNLIGDNAYSVQGDFDNDGEDDFFYKIHAPAVGDYSVQVVAQPNALPSDTFTLLIGSADSVITIAREIQVADIPDEPYRIEVTEAGIELVGGVCSPLQFINYGPNPVPAEGCIFWLNLPDDARDATLKILDIDGALLVSIPLDPTMNRYPAAGRWIPDDDQGRLLGTGLYLYIVKIEHTDGTTTYSQVQKMVIKR